MEPISGNSPIRINQPQAQQSEQVKQPRQEEVAPQPLADRYTANSPVLELQLQRSQVVEGLERVQQAGTDQPGPINNEQSNALPYQEQAIANRFPDQETELVQAQAQQLSDQLQRDIQQQPERAISAQANASEQTRLTLFQ